MAEYKAKLSYLKIAPRKVRLVADLIRGGNVRDAKTQLRFSTKRAAVSLLKLLNSAVSNAKNLKEDTKEETLFIKKITVDEGPKLKRFRPVARGRAVEIQKKTSHVSLVIAETELSPENKTIKTRAKTKVSKDKS
ncbi:MAG: 50S ribosomal protein L22 [Candidatus Spechtbacterales bacterium]